MSVEVVSLRDYVEMRFIYQDRLDRASRDYTDMRFDYQERMVALALTSADRAVNKAEVASEKRFDGVNEFRGALSDSQRTLMPRLEAEQFFRVLADKIDSQGKRLDAKDNVTAGKAEGWVKIGLAISILANLVLMVSHFNWGHP